MTIGFWGDSITYGACDSEALGWVGRIRKELSSDVDGASFYNFGVCGDTTTTLLKRFMTEAEAIQPDEIVFAIGINDSKYPNDTETNFVSLPEYGQNLELLISQAQQYTNKITIVGTTGVNDVWRSVKGSRFLNEEIQKYNAMMKKIAQAKKLLFIEMFDVLNTNADLADGLHPNAQGYQKMFEKFKTMKILAL